MAYSTSNPPALVNVGGIAGYGNEWLLKNTDAVTTVRVSGYISNAKTLGIKAGDRLEYIKTDASPLTRHIFIVSAINANGSADLSDGTAITSTNTD